MIVAAVKGGLTTAGLCCWHLDTAACLSQKLQTGKAYVGTHGVDDARYEKSHTWRVIASDIHAGLLLRTGHTASCQAILEPIVR
jgi:hypothetical protein